jgi:hypothetical protein
MDAILVARHAQNQLKIDLGVAPSVPRRNVIDRTFNQLHRLTTFWVRHVFEILKVENLRPKCRRSVQLFENLRSSVAGSNDGEVNHQTASSVFIKKRKQGRESHIKSHSY